MPIVVRGLHELQAALAHADRDLRLGVRRGLREAAEPVQRGAEELAQANFSHIGHGRRNWSRMRVGVTRNLVYVAPRQRGTRGGRGPASRHRSDLIFAERLMGRAMEPALDQHGREVEARFEELLDRISDDFNRGGI
jgi:hypothetical protein